MQGYRILAALTAFPSVGNISLSESDYFHFQIPFVIIYIVQISVIRGHKSSYKPPTLKLSFLPLSYVQTFSEWLIQQNLSKGADGDVCHFVFVLIAISRSIKINKMSFY